MRAFGSRLKEVALPGPRLPAVFGERRNFLTLRWIKGLPVLCEYRCPHVFEHLSQASKLSHELELRAVQSSVDRARHETDDEAIRVLGRMDHRIADQVPALTFRDPHRPRCGPASRCRLGIVADADALH